MTQRMVAVRKDGGSFLLAGDHEENTSENMHRKVLPFLLNAGWVIASVNMTASAAVNDDQVLGLVVLHKF